MGSIEQYVQTTMPQTYEALKTTYTNPDVVRLTVTRVMNELFMPGTDEFDLVEVVRAHVADIVAYRLTDTGIDHWQKKAVLSDGSRGESLSYYDRTKGLRDLKPVLKSRIAAQEGVLTLVPELLLVTGGLPRSSGIPRISPAGAFRTLDPLEFPPMEA